MNKIAALLSGGVDSASALAKYIETFPQHKPLITAYYLKIWLEDELSFLGQCPWEEDLAYATEVANQLGVRLQVVSLQREYYEKVVSYTLDELKGGGTPSPDIFCNERIKFGAFLDKVEEQDKIISGHYASVVYRPPQSDLQEHSERDFQEQSIPRLYRSVDSVKDQSYFLSHLSSTQLSKLEFPLGTMHKKEVRAYAKEKKLAPFERKDSQGICFLGKIKYSDFVKYHLGSKDGSIVNIDKGNILGRHQGSWFYTIGQRTGLGLGGGPWYVCKKSFDENTVYVRHGDMLANSVVDSLAVSNIHFINKISALPGQAADRAQPTEHKVPSAHDARSIGQDKLSGDSSSPTTTDERILNNLSVKLRHGPTLIPASLRFDPSTQRGLVQLAEGDPGIAEGQFTVFYSGQECLGCARISLSE